MKNLTLALILLISANMQAQKSTQSVSFSIKEKFNQIISQNFSKANAETSSAFELSLVPNPVTSHLHVNSTGHIKKIMLIDSKGKVVRRVRLKDSKSYTFDTSSLGKGDFKVVISHYDHKRTEIFENI